MDLELCAIKLCLKDSVKISIFGIYRSPNGNIESFFDKLENLFYIHVRNCPFFLCGDINVDWSNASIALSNFKDLLDVFNLRQLVDSPTRVDIVSGRASLLDWAVTNIQPTEVAVDVVETGLSDHLAQILNISGPTTSEPSTHTMRPLTKNNLDLLNILLSNERWGALENVENVSDSFDKFLDTFIYNLDLACPKKKNEIYR